MRVERKSRCARRAKPTHAGGVDEGVLQKYDENGGMDGGKVATSLQPQCADFDEPNPHAIQEEAPREHEHHLDELRRPHQTREEEDEVHKAELEQAQSRANNHPQETRTRNNDMTKRKWKPVVKSDSSPRPLQSVDRAKNRR